MVLNVEKDHTDLLIESMPAIIRFLGYDSFTESERIPERLRPKRRRMGWSISETVCRLGLDPETPPSPARNGDQNRADRCVSSAEERRPV
jgi:hypothetical protein